MLGDRAGVGEALLEDRRGHRREQVGVATGADEVVLVGDLRGAAAARVDDHDLAAALLDGTQAAPEVRRGHQRSVRGQRVGAEDQHVLGAIDVWDRQAQPGTEHEPAGDLLGQLVDARRAEHVAGTERLDHRPQVHDSIEVVGVRVTEVDGGGVAVAAGEYRVVIVDSIQTIAANAIASAAGSVSQITNSTQLISYAAKQAGTALILVGHVTKEGSIAGPKVLEHVVDVVLQLEGDRYGGFKVLRAVKNRYGSTNEAAILEMKDDGLMPVENPSAALLAERQVSDGSVVLATMEGTRPLLVEVQALVNRTSYGYPKRTASGLDINRLNLLIAMLERRTKLNLADHDIYVNVVGGIRISEPAADLAVVMAIASAAKGMQLKSNAVVFGEVGLSGEIRHVPYADKRIAEAKKLGFDAAIGPVSSALKKEKNYYGIKDVRSALNTFLEKD